MTGLQLPPMRLEWHLGDAVRKAREARGYTQPQLAKRAKVNKASIVRIEHGQVMKTDTVQKIAVKGLQISEAALYKLVPPTMEVPDLSDFVPMKELEQHAVTTLARLEGRALQKNHPPSQPLRKKLRHK